MRASHALERNTTPWNAVPCVLVGHNLTVSVGHMMYKAWHTTTTSATTTSTTTTTTQTHPGALGHKGPAV